MILTDLLGCRAAGADRAKLGTVIDVRFAIDGALGQVLADARVVGLIVSPHSRASLWGYERTGVRGPWPIPQLLGRMHRGLFLVAWEDVALIDDGLVTLRDGFTRLDPALPGHTARRS